MKSQKIICLGTVAGLALLTPMAALSQATPSSAPPQRGQLSESDYRFLMKAARGGMEEIQAGQLAQQKGSDQAVRNFGEHMVTQHTHVNEQLKQIAAQKGATLPSRLTHGERSTLEDLQKETGADFDKAYAKDMVKDHKEDVKEFQSAASDLTDPDLKAFAQKTIPTLQHHLNMAEDMERSVKMEKSP